MPNPVLVCVENEGTLRRLFSVQERTSGDLTIIVKQTRFATFGHDLTPTREGDAIIEERFSVHVSPQSKDSNIIKYTRVVEGGRARHDYNFTAAMKKFNRFAVIFARRVGGILDERYIVDPKGSRVVSLGECSQYFNPVFVVLVGAKDREFKMPGGTKINFCQVPFERFNLIVLWQFFMNDGEQSARSLIPQTFSDEDIAAAPPEKREGMEAMARGKTENEMISLFAHLKQEFVNYLLDAVRQQNKFGPVHRAVSMFDMYCQSGKAFTEEHRSLHAKVVSWATWYRTSGAPTVKDTE
jgi:hypothetical protein